MTSAWNGRIYDANKNSGKHFEIIWDAQGLDWDLLAIPKGDPRMDDAYKFIAFASRPAAQAEQPTRSPMVPATRTRCRKSIRRSCRICRRRRIT